MKKTVCLIFSAMVFSGCLTTDTKEQVALSDKQVNAYLENMRMPQQFGFQVMPLPGGGFIHKGACRTHENHKAEAEFRHETKPVIHVRGRSRVKKMNMLVDVATPYSWLSYQEAMEFSALPLGLDGNPIPYRGPGQTGGVEAYASVITQLRIHQLFLEDVPMYVRMATGPVGPFARGIEDPIITGVLGYDNLSQLEFIQYDFKNKMLRFSATIPYSPTDKALKAPILKKRGYGLVVDGAIYDAGTTEIKHTPMVIDPVGDYSFIRTDKAAPTTKQISFGDVVLRTVPTQLYQAADALPRIGQEILSDYILTICPKEGIVYFERPYENDHFLF